MVLISAGEFDIGSASGEVMGPKSDKGSVHTVKIAKPFAIGRCEVTFDDYDAFVEQTGRRPPDDEGWGRGKRPVVNVDWEDARAYAQWLSEETASKYRLPTEAEWEYVAKAGTTTAYWWGDDAGKNNANCQGCGSQWDSTQTAPAGSFAANPFGLHDTAGNVWEWVQDCWHDNYDNAPIDGTAWEEANDGDCGRRVIRGGSWGFSPGGLRSATRGGLYSVGRTGIIGFRLAQDL